MSYLTTAEGGCATRLLVRAKGGHATRLVCEANGLTIVRQLQASAEVLGSR